MAKITYIDHLNKEYIVEIPEGMSIMDGAIQSNIPGIEAECGGACACATCHVYVEKKFYDKIPNKISAEQDMLDMAFQPNKFSRLSCQIIVTENLDGMVVQLPLKQS